MFNTIFCFLGFHTWSEWSRWKSKTEASCERQRICQSCKTKELEEKTHQWNNRWDYARADSCQQTQTCQLCSEKSKETRLEHIWGTWEYFSSDSCQQLRICQRCGQKETRAAQHVWKNIWEYTLPNACQQNRICQRCGEKSSETRTEHIWGIWDYLASDSCQQIRTCQRCAEKEYQSANHTWGDIWNYIDDDSCRQSTVCQRCKSKNDKEERVEHVWGSWSEWEKESSYSCQQTRICKRCNNKETHSEQHDWSSWEYLSSTSYEQTKFCRRCNTKENRRIEEYQRIIRNITKTILDELEYFGDNFKVERPATDDVLADENYKASYFLNQIGSAVYQSQCHLQQEPFVAYVKAEIDGQEKILLVCRAYTPLKLSPKTRTAMFISSRAPLGQIATYEVGYIDSIVVPKGEIEIKVLEKNSFRPIETARGWDGRENQFSLSSGSYFVESLLNIAITEGLRREFIDEFALRDTAILDRAQSEIYTLPLKRQVIIEGAPGTGKTTTLIKRIAQKSLPEPKFLDELDIRGIDNSYLLERFFNNRNWTLFTPAEPLKFFLRTALSKELLPHGDELIKTWESERVKLAKDVLHILGSNGFYSRTNTELLCVKTNSDLLSYADKFLKFSEQYVQDKLIGLIKTREYVDWYISQIPKQYYQFRLNQLGQEALFLNTQHTQEIRDKKISDLELDLLIFVMLKNAQEKIFLHRSYRELLDDDLKNRDKIDILENIKAQYKTQIIIDEATDFSTLQLGCMVYLAHPRYQSVTLAGDLMQRMTSLGLANWEEFRSFLSGIRFEIQRLDKVYRQRPKLLKIAEKLYKKVINQNPPFKPAMNENITDPDPLRFDSQNNPTSSGQWIADRINEIYKINKMKLPSIAIFVSNDSQIKQLYEIIQQPLKDYGIEVKTYSESTVGSYQTAIFSGESFAEGEGKVKILSTKYIKGLEFEAVFLYDINQIAHETPELVASYVYTALTRAVSFLSITYNTFFPESLRFIQEQFKESTWRSLIK